MLLKVRNMSQKVCRENQFPRYMFNNYFPKNRNVYDKMWRNTVEGAGHRLQYCACALRARYLRLQIHTQNPPTLVFDASNIAHEQKRLDSKILTRIFKIYQV